MDLGIWLRSLGLERYERGLPRERDRGKGPAEPVPLTLGERLYGRNSGRSITVRMRLGGSLNLFGPFLEKPRRIEFGPPQTKYLAWRAPLGSR